MNGIPEIQIDEAKKKFDQQDCMFVDIRDPGSYRAAHIPGAVHLHDGNVQEFIEGADKDREVIVYCYHGNSSLGAVAYFWKTDSKCRERAWRLRNLAASL